MMTFRKKVMAGVAVGVMAMVGCSSASKEAKFEKIVPDMSQDDVRKTMEEGPTRFEKAGKNGEYSSWYWGDDQCVLFQGGKVVAKDSATKGANASIGPGKYEEKRAAQCLAPGEVADAGKDRTINIPGVGTINIPKSKAQGS